MDKNKQLTEMRPTDRQRFEYGGYNIPIDLSLVTVGDFQAIMTATDDNKRFAATIALCDKAFRGQFLTMPIIYMPLVTARVLEEITFLVSPPSLDDTTDE